MADPIIPSSIDIHHHFHIGGMDTSRLEALIMSQFAELLTQLQTEFAAMNARLDEDIAELQRLISEAQITADERAGFNAIIAQMQGHNVLPDFPPAPEEPEEPEPPVEEEPPAEEPTV